MLLCLLWSTLNFLVAEMCYINKLALSCLVFSSSWLSCQSGKIMTIVTSEKVLIYCHGNTDKFRHKYKPHASMCFSCSTVGSNCDTHEIMTCMNWSWLRFDNITCLNHSEHFVSVLTHLLRKISVGRDTNSATISRNPPTVSCDQSQHENWYLTSSFQLSDHNWTLTSSKGGLRML